MLSQKNTDTDNADTSNTRVVAYASRSLTDTERRYSQVERETLAAAWGCEHFNLFNLYGHPFTLVTDNTPLKQIWDNPRSKPPVRIERWIMRLQKYDFVLVHCPGPSNPADYMSRHPAESGTKKVPIASSTAEDYVNYLTLNAVPKAMTLIEIQEATLVDPTLQAAVDCIQTGQWYKSLDKDINVDQVALKALYNVRDELTFNSKDKILLRGIRIVVPVSLQDKAATLAHVGHQGIVKTKALLREKIWFPGVDKKVETLIQQCGIC